MVAASASKLNLDAPFGVATLPAGSPLASRRCGKYPCEETTASASWNDSAVSSFSIVRSTSINAGLEGVYGLISDFRNWPTWSPWEDLDSNLERTYSGAEAGVGSSYSWDGDRKAGAGRMEIVAATPTQLDLQLEFTRPWKAKNQVRFELAASADSTVVTWTMSGENTWIGAIFSKLFNLDAMLGKDFEKGLRQLKAAAEG